MTFKGTHETEADAAEYVSSSPSFFSNLRRYFIGLVDRRSKEVRIFPASFIHLRQTVNVEEDSNEDEVVPKTEDYFNKLQNFHKTFGAPRNVRMLQAKNETRLDNDMIRGFSSIQKNPNASSPAKLPSKVLSSSSKSNNGTPIKINNETKKKKFTPSKKEQSTTPSKKAKK